VEEVEVVAITEDEVVAYSQNYLVFFSTETKSQSLHFIFHYLDHTALVHTHIPDF
jgi:hypothetical protein